MWFIKLLKWAKYQGGSQVTNATVLTWLRQLENEEKTNHGHRKTGIPESGDLIPEAVYDTQLTGWWGYCMQLNKELANLYSSSLGAASVQEKIMMDIFSTHCQYSHSDPRRALPSLWASPGEFCHRHGDEALGSRTWPSPCQHTFAQDCSLPTASYQGKELRIFLSTCYFLFVCWGCVLFCLKTAPGLERWFTR